MENPFFNTLTLSPVILTQGEMISPTLTFAIFSQNTVTNISSATLIAYSSPNQ
ncbi:hypothetical protein KPN_00267 [Klebsiella pneumoniae subsp. pneumoniae MGH 78578]|uniref:Uncharacterized protein n=1 Tax=Klebsiella pneumoniae subsp. pneumoniae (strain ATCC 700721 / MGH 78578) TaxID=272620 RepID=A6T549_KLEP7|nr:hypothetical protein KPN_00267 [Klebsiella pneumoniae subsp. pneumoniae MGH 78578]